MYKRPLPSEAEVMDRILTVAPADAHPSRHSAASSDLRRSTGARPQTADAATATRTPKRKFVLKAVAANKKHRVGSTNAAAAAAAGVKRRPANTAATTENDPIAERRRVVAAAPTQVADEREPLAAGAGAGPGGVNAAEATADAVASGASTVAVTAASPLAMACGDGNSGAGELGGGEEAAAVSQGKAVAERGGVGAEPLREKEATDGPRLEQTAPSSSGSSTSSAAAATTAAPLAGTAGATTASSQVEEREKQGMTMDECAEAAPAGQGQAAQAAGRQRTEGTATAIGDERAIEEEPGADEFDLGPTKSSGDGGVQSRTIRGGDGNQVDGGGGGGDGDGEGCGSEGGTDKPKEASSGEDEDGRKEGADSTVPDVIVTANYVGKFLKNRVRQKWKLKLEGGAIEGEGQVFVFDECNCELDPLGP